MGRTPAAACGGGSAAVELNLEREWSAVTNTFAYDFSFLQRAYRLASPVSGLVAAAMADEDVRRPFGW